MLGLLQLRETRLFERLAGKMAKAAKDKAKGGIFDTWMLRESDLIQVQFY